MTATNLLFQVVTSVLEEARDDDTHYDPYRECRDYRDALQAL